MEMSGWSLRHLGHTLGRAYKTLISLGLSLSLFLVGVAMYSLPCCKIDHPLSVWSRVALAVSYVCYAIWTISLQI